MPYQIAKNINTGELFKITTPNGTVYHIQIASIGTLTGGFTDEFTLSNKTHNYGYSLNWHNCYSFGNGVESNRVRDNFNQPFLTPGARVSTVFEDYKEEERSNSLIFSGIYNSIGNVNNLNQFIQAEQITKELNPTYGSVQKLFTRDSDLVVLCEDKVLKVLGHKDAVYNADGNPQLTANQNVLGQSIPFVGEYGISKNPESFVSEAYRSYFTDKQRGTVMRLSKDGLTPISLHGMKDFFRGELKNNTTLLGTYDKKKDEYNVTLSSRSVTFNENVKGWSSFKSFVPESGLGCSGDYYTFDKGKIYKHHDESQSRNNFYGNQYFSRVNVLLNDAPSNIKTYNTVDYEGTKDWYVLANGIKTDQGVATVSEFVEKEGKYYNYIHGIERPTVAAEDLALTSVQSAGLLLNTPQIDETDANGVVTPLTDLNLQVGSLNSSMQVNDILYYVKASDLAGGADHSNIVKYGAIKNIKGEIYPGYAVKTIVVEQQGYVLNNPVLEQGDFLMFVKDLRANKASISGYYADITIVNESTSAAELFTVASEIQESSK